MEFANVVTADRKYYGVPLRFAYTPHPVAGMTPSVLRGYVEGVDPATGRRLMDELVEALTKPLEPAEPPAQSEPTHPVADVLPGTRESSRLVPPDTEDNLQRLFYERGWTDGLPIILPTEERVEEMLAGTTHAAEEMVGEIYLQRTFERVSLTVEMVAIVGVMAGARPEHLPVLLAVASTGEPSIPRSTTPFGRMLLVNGPVRHELGMNTGIGAFSPRTLSNSVIGRSWTLLTIAWGCFRLKQQFWTSQGNPVSYSNMCVGENEEASPWEAFHVEKGFEAAESTVSLFRGWNFVNNVAGSSHRSVGEDMFIQLRPLVSPYSAATFILDPLVARHLASDLGFATKAGFCRWLAEHFTMPAGEYWDNDVVDMLVGPLASRGVEPYSTWRRLPAGDLIAPYDKPEAMNVVVVGGETSPMWKVSDFSYTVSASIDRWRATPPSAECTGGGCGLPDHSETKAEG
jgi:hypothetical protein